MKRKTLLDFTPLLDVILILLFLVLMSSADAHAEEVESMEAQKGALQDQVVELQKEVESLEANQMTMNATEQGWYEVYQDAISKMDLIYPSSPEESMIMRYEDGSSYRRAQTDEFEDWLKAAVGRRQHDIAIITFSYDDNSIFWRDYQRTKDAIIRLTRQDDHLIYAEKQLERTIHE